MINKQFDQIDKTDIDALLANQESETRTLEYKQELPGNKDDDKKEFLADVSSFANASGGDIVYGVKEQRDSDGHTTGLPESIDGLPGINNDVEIRRLDDMIRSGIDPRINGIQIKPIDGFTNGPTILIRIPRSWSAPHRVIFKNWGHFFSRNSAGKYTLDVTELRSAFVYSETIAERMQKFHDERLGRIVAGDTPVPLYWESRIVLHLLPIASFGSDDKIDLRVVDRNYGSLHPIFGQALYHRYNIDGHVIAAWTQDLKVYGGYMQTFRNGAIEAVDGVLLRELPDTKPRIPITTVEREIISATKRYVTLLDQLNIAPPIVFLLSLIGVKNRTISPDYTSSLSQGSPFDRDSLLLPDVIIEDYTSSVDGLLRPVFDSLWQAAGYPECPNYDKQGQWHLISSGSI